MSSQKETIIVTQLARALKAYLALRGEPVPAGKQIELGVGTIDTDEKTVTVHYSFVNIPDYEPDEEDE